MALSGREFRTCSMKRVLMARQKTVAGLKEHLLVLEQP
jgi:hypothetical protein